MTVNWFKQKPPKVDSISLPASASQSARVMFLFSVFVHPFVKSEKRPGSDDKLHKYTQLRFGQGQSTLPSGGKNIENQPLKVF